MALLERSESYGELQRVVDYLYKNARIVERLDVILAAETFDICADLREIVELLPPGGYTRIALCTQLNSSIAGHGWGYTYGTVE
ncbi:MAG: hypothetical protein Q4B69_07715 [Slackia sp.]|nr:hypothetical protein [Slackia sp.]